MEKLLKQASLFHGHTCPGLAMGVRVAEYVLREFAPRPLDEELVAIVENNSCAVDAVQLLLGCTFGKGNLVFNDYGKQVYTFIKRPSREALRISVNWIATPERPEEKKLWERYSAGDRSEEVMRAVHRRKSEKIKAITGAPDTELFTVKKWKARSMPCEARILQSIACEKCGEKTMETRLRMMKGKLYCIPCFTSGFDTRFNKETKCARS